MKKNEKLKNKSSGERNVRGCFKDKSKSDSMLNNIAKNKNTNLKTRAEIRSLTSSNIIGFNKKFNSRIPIIEVSSSNENVNVF